MIPTLLQSTDIITYLSEGGTFYLPAPVIAMLISITGYYLAEVVLYGKEAAFIISVTTNLIQGIGSAAVFYILGAALDKAGVKNILIPQKN